MEFIEHMIMGILLTVLVGMLLFSLFMLFKEIYGALKEHKPSRKSKRVSLVYYKGNHVLFYDNLWNHTIEEFGINDITEVVYKTEYSKHTKENYLIVTIEIGDIDMELSILIYDTSYKPTMLDCNAPISIMFAIEDFVGKPLEEIL